MTYYRDGIRVYTTIFEAAAFQYAIKARCCRCGHSNILDPHALWWHFERKGWDNRLTKAAARFRCLRCPVSTRVELTLVREEATLDRLPMPDIGTWKRAINRFRS
ncbi:hypothetical protein GCM10009087_40490 [Sphingomonas oligophenolica]|uniref:Zinc-ribbon domain-containing protein n=1 Tax=Sphingomonas oligophenolica TaxID=301154 RepID=A0ABU9Y236_9SPHN